MGRRGAEEKERGRENYITQNAQKLLREPPSPREHFNNRIVFNCAIPRRPRFRTMKSQYRALLVRVTTKYTKVKTDTRLVQNLRTLSSLLRGNILLRAISKLISGRSLISPRANACNPLYAQRMIELKRARRLVLQTRAASPQIRSLELPVSSPSLSLSLLLFL